MAYFRSGTRAISGHCTSPGHVTLGSMSVERRFSRGAAQALCLLCSGCAFLLAYAVSDKLVVSAYVAHAVGFGCVVACTLAVSRFAPDRVSSVRPIVLGGLALVAGAYALR